MDIIRVFGRRGVTRPVLIGAGLAFAWLGASLVLGLNGSGAHADTRDPGPLDGVTSTVSRVAEDVVSPVASAISPVVTPVAHAVTPVVHAASAPVAHVTTPVAAVIAPAATSVAPVAQAAAPVVAAVTGATSSVTAPVTDVLAPVAGALRPVLDPVNSALAPVGDALAPVLTTLQPVLDPVAGGLPPVVSPPVVSPGSATQTTIEPAGGSEFIAPAGVSGGFSFDAALTTLRAVVTTAGAASGLPLAPGDSGTPFSPLTAMAATSVSSGASGTGLGLLALSAVGFVFARPLAGLARRRADDRLPVSATFETDSSPD